MNLKFYNILPPPIRYLEKWRLCIWHCCMFAESNRTAPNSTKFHINENFDYYFVKWVLALEISDTPINYAWLNSPTIVLCFLDSVEAQYWLFKSACLPTYYFFRLPSRLLFKLFQDQHSGGCDFDF